jgi:hypothetical protein
MIPAGDSAISVLVPPRMRSLCSSWSVHAGQASAPLGTAIAVKPGNVPVTLTFIGRIASLAYCGSLRFVLEVAPNEVICVTLGRIATRVRAGEHLANSSTKR